MVAASATVDGSGTGASGAVAGSAPEPQEWSPPVAQLDEGRHPEIGAGGRRT